MKLTHFSLAAFAMALTASAFAADPAPTTTTTTTTVTTTPDGKTKTIKMIKVINMRGGEAQMVDPEKAATIVAMCDGKKQEINAATDEEKGQKGQIRIITCEKGNIATGEDAAKHLAEARKHIADDKDLSPEVKAKILHKLDEAIAKQSAKPSGG